MRFLKLLAIIVPLTLAACGNNHSTNETAGRPGPQDMDKPKDLSFLSTPEVISTKFLSAILNCNLWTRMHGPLFINDAPDDRVSIDLMKEATFPKTISLTGKSEMHSLEIQIKLAGVKIEINSGYSNNYGENYSFTNSPAVFGEYSGQAITRYPRGYVGNQFQGNNLIINENIVSQIVAGSSGPRGEPAPTVDYVECSVDTILKPAYIGEWRKTSVGHPPSCLLGQSIPTDQCMIQKK